MKYSTLIIAGCYLTFWKVDGMTTLKQSRKTSVFG